LSARDPIKVYDARWEVHEFDDDAIVRMFQATYAYGRQIGVDTVALARDGRLGAAHVLELAVDTAVRAGLRVCLCPDPISTPQGYFLALHTSREHPGTMGLMVTASHNPKNYIGVKFTVPTVQAIGEDCGPMGGLSEIRRIYRKGAKLGRTAGGSLHVVNVAREYIEFSMQEAGIGPGDLDGLSVVLDGFHGSAGPEVMTALQRAGVRVEALRLIPDGHFPTGSPNPTSQGKMDPAVAITAERNCMASIALDGDGDRLVFGDRRGIFNAGFAAVPILRTCVRKHVASRAIPAPGNAHDRVLALYDPKVNPLALREWGSLNVRPVLFRNGHSQIKDYMRRIGAVAAAEESGHYYHRITMGDLAVCCENSILTALLFLGAMKSQPELLDELWSMQSAVRTTGEFNYQFPDDDTRDRALAAVIGHVVGQGAATVTATPDGIDLQGTVVSKGVTIDDAGVHLEPGWYSGYLRHATNEKGVVRSYFSAADPALIERLEADARRILSEDFRGVVID
jgi:phosphomannomutase